jgi:CDP-paratose 2-epimerase
MLERELGWEAKVGWHSGLRHLAEWLVENRFGGRRLLVEEKRKARA